jgi:hypothetical protein
MWSGWPMLLPMLEASNLYDACNFSLPSTHPSNLTAISTPLGLFVCPSFADAAPVPIYTNPSDPTSAIAYYAGPSNYKGNMSGGLRPGCTNPTNPACMTFDNGVFFRNSGIAFRDVTDGASNTIFMAESIEGLWADATYCCVRTSPDRNVNERAGGVFTVPRYWNSMHPGAIMILLGDGSSRSISDTIDNTVMIRLMTRAGNDPVQDDEF